MMIALNRIIQLCCRYLLHQGYWLVQLYSRRKGSDNSANQSVKRIHHMDENLPEDIEDVLELSAILEIREFDLFGLAYHWWFGRVPSHEVLESHFCRYMFNKIVPHWVRHYSRMVFDLKLQGKLDREALGISRLPDATPQSIRAGLRYAVIVFSSLAILILIAELAVQYSVLPCMFPPCY